jgi:hypothetical protein
LGQRKLALARVRGDKSREEQRREDENRNNDFVVEKNDGDGVKRYHTSLSGMPHFDKANAALD